MDTETVTRSPLSLFHILSARNNGREGKRKREREREVGVGVVRIHFLQPKSDLAFYSTFSTFFFFFLSFLLARHNYRIGMKLASKTQVFSGTLIIFAPAHQLQRSRAIRSGDPMERQNEQLSVSLDDKIKFCDHFFRLPNLSFMPYVCSLDSNTKPDRILLSLNSGSTKMMPKSDNFSAYISERRIRPTNKMKKMSKRNSPDLVYL